MANIPTNWAYPSLGEIAQIASGGTPDRNNKDYWNGTIPWVSTGEVNFNTINHCC